MNALSSIFFVACIAASSAWHLRVSLNDIFKGHCRTVSPRVCRKSLEKFDPDYNCGFILRSVCSGTNKIERVRTRRSALQPNHEHTLHVTPLPKKMAFYDANADGQISIKEFARTLGHDPRAFHVKDAFRVADANGDGLVDGYEFENDAWIFDDDFDDDDYNLEDTDEDSYKSVNFDLLDGSSEESSSSSESSESSSQSSGESASNDHSYADSNDVDYDDLINGKDSSSSEENGVSSSSSSDDSNNDSGSHSGDNDSNSSGDSKSSGSNSASSGSNSDSADNSDHSNDASNGIDDGSNSKSVEGDDNSSQSKNDDSKDNDSKDSKSKDDDDSKEGKKHDGLDEVFPDDLNLSEIVPKEMELGDGVIGEAIENVIGDGMELELPELEGPDSDTMKNVGIAMALTKFQPNQNQIHPKTDSHGVDGHDHADHSHSDFDFSKGQTNYIADAMNPKPTMLSNALLGIGGTGGGSRMRSGMVQGSSGEFVVLQPHRIMDSTQARERFNAIAMNNRRRVPASLWPSWIVS